MDSGEPQKLTYADPAVTTLSERTALHDQMAAVAGFVVLGLAVAALAGLIVVPLFAEERNLPDVLSFGCFILMTPISIGTGLHGLISILCGRKRWRHLRGAGITLATWAVLVCIAYCNRKGMIHLIH